MGHWLPHVLDVANELHIQIVSNVLESAQNDHSSISEDCIVPTIRNKLEPVESRLSYLVIIVQEEGMAKRYHLLLLYRRSSICSKFKINRPLLDNQLRSKTLYPFLLAPDPLALRLAH